MGVKLANLGKRGLMPARPERIAQSLSVPGGGGESYQKYPRIKNVRALKLRLFSRIKIIKLISFCRPDVNVLKIIFSALMGLALGPLGGLSLEGVSLEGLSLEGMSLEGVSLEGMSLEGVSLEGVSLEDIAQATLFDELSACTPSWVKYFPGDQFR
jgi:hypothetical protein